MPDAIRIELSEEAKELLAAVKAIPTEGMQVMAKAMDRQNLLTVSHIKRTYLSFPRSEPPTPLGLRVITNRLQSSYLPEPAEVSGQRIESAIGSNVEYAAVHEFGFDGEVGVGQHNRKLYRTKFLRGGKTLKNKVLRGVTQVGQHTRHAHIPARAPVQRGIADRAGQYGLALSDALVGILNGKGGQ